MIYPTFDFIWDFRANLKTTRVLSSLEFQVWHTTKVLTLITKIEHGKN